MKSMIDDYFGQSPRGNQNAESQPVPNNDVSIKVITANDSSHQGISETVKTDGKENVTVKGKGSSRKCSKEKSKTSLGNDSSKAKKSHKKKSLSTFKLKCDDKSPESNTNISSNEIVKDNKSPTQNFSLKIRLKSQEACEKDKYIEEFSSPEHTDGKSKEFKSPQSTMLKYLIPPKNPSPAEKDCSTASKVKVIRDISDYFSPSKQTKTCVTPSAVPEVETKTSSKPAKAEELEKNTSDESKKKTRRLKKTNKASLCSKSAKNSKQNCQTDFSNSKSEEHLNLPTDIAEASNPTTNSSRVVKLKSTKKSLCLAKNEISTKTLEPSLHLEVKTLESGDEEKLLVAKSISTAFKQIMSKSLNETTLEDCLPVKPGNASTKKRKRDEDDDMSNKKLSKTLREDSPVKSRRRRSKSNQIDSDSDGDVSMEKDIKKTDDSSIPNGNFDLAAVEDLPKSEESKRNSLMNYFSKVSKEEVLAKDDKIEMKVKALVHSPPTTPSKKTKRRSIHSLPGGAASLSKKKVNVKAKLRENINAIDVIDVEEINGSDKKSKEPTSIPPVCKMQPNSSSTSSVKSVKAQSLKVSPYPQKNQLPLESGDLLNSKCKAAPKTSKRTLSRGKGKQEIKNNSSSDSTLTKSIKSTISLEEECLAVPLETMKDVSQIVASKPLSDSRMPWKLRVCLTSLQLPTDQGTLLEEESDCDEIFLQRKDKKRKLERKCIGDKLKQIQPTDKVKEAVIKKKSTSPEIIFEKETSSNVKIAPLFTRKADSQARQLFLQSGVPDQVKRALGTQRSFEEQETEIFPKESHIQQINVKDWIWNLPTVTLSFKVSCIEEMPDTLVKFSLSDLTGCCNLREEVDHIVSASCKGPEMRALFGLPLYIVKPILRLMKQESPDFKVVNTFKALKSKFRKEEFLKAAALSTFSEIHRPKRKSSNRKSINSKQPPMVTYRAHAWTEKYKPCTASEIIGNSASIQQLKRWLESWRKACEDFSNKPSSKEEIKRRKEKKDAYDDDDFLVSENSSEGAQSNVPIGLAVLYGPNGSGKTSSVYALAKDLGYKVLEVNASEKRNGKWVLSKLSEATQSHQVQQGNTAEQGFAALFGNNLNTVKSGGKQSCKTKTSKPSSDLDEDKAKKMSLILFEDVDVVFEEEDEGFLSAISTLVSTSKRPVILTTTDPESPMVSRFINSTSLNLPFSNPHNLLSTWLQIVSLLEGVYVAPDTVKNLVSLCKGDFRRALLQMQLWVLSGGNNVPMPSITYSQQGPKTKKVSKNEDIDDMSDLDDDNDHENCTPSIPANPDCTAVFLGRNNIHDDIKDTGKNNTFVKVPFPLDLGLFWWNSPPLLSLKQLEHAELPVVKEDPPILGARRMLDDSFIASFCTDDGSITDSGVNEDSAAPCIQETSAEESGESQKIGQTDSNPSLSSEGPTSYTSYCSEKEMMAISSLALSLSSIDVIAHSSQLNTSSNMEPITRFSYPLLKDSLSLIKLEVDGPNCVLNTMAEELCHWLAEQSLNETRTCLCPDNLSPSPYNYCLPSLEEYRWRDAHAQAEQAALQAVPLCVLLERRTVFMDYMPMLRTICRLERNRSIINTKRRNRFYHYLKSLGAHLTEAQLELLCRSMCGL